MSTNGSLKPKQKAEVKRMLKSALDDAIDDKIVHYNFTSNVGTAGVVLPMALLTKGTEEYQRIGTKIAGKSITVRGYIRGDSSAAVMRVIVGFYESVGGVLPTPTSILRSVTAAGTAALAYKADYNYDKREDFRILYDKCHPLSGFAGVSRLAAGSAIQTADSYQNVKWPCLEIHVKCKHKTSYLVAGNAGTIADVETGLPFVLLISDNNTNLPTYDLSCIYRFEDA